MKTRQPLYDAVPFTATDRRYSRPKRRCSCPLSDDGETVNSIIVFFATVTPLKKR